MKKHINYYWKPFLIIAFPFVMLMSCGVRDSTIQESVDAALKNNSDLAAVTATVKDGVVTLTGESKTESSKSAIESELAKIKGVKQVVNNMSVTPPPAPAAVTISPDEELLKKVMDATKDYPDVKAEVKDGVVTLTGQIKRSGLQPLMKTLHTLQPKKIENKLTIK